jgi:Flp pilus assembly protein TadB
MANEPPLNDMRNVWQTQAVEAREMSLSGIRKKAYLFQAGLRRANLWAYALLAGLVAAFGWIAFRSQNFLARTGACVFIAGYLYVFYQVYTRGGRRSVPAACGDCLNFYRSELKRLRDFHNAVWSRVLAIIPGYMLVCAGMAKANSRLAWSAIAGIFLAFSFYGVWLQYRLARRVQREIDTLETAGKRN